MDLYHSPASPFVRKIMVLLNETGRTRDVTLKPVHVTPVTPDSGHAALAPLGKVPALTRPDGPAIYDSRVIARYLDATFGAGLYPEHRLWETLTLEALADGIMEAAVLMVYEGRLRPEDKQFAPWVDAQWGKVARGLDAANDLWLSHLSGKLDMGQIGMACALGYLDFRHDARNWRQGRDGLAAWHARFDARPSMQATRPE